MTKNIYPHRLSRKLYEKMKDTMIKEKRKHKEQPW